MIIGEIVEILIQMRDNMVLDRGTDEAVCAACNILDELPRLEEAEIVREQLRERKKEN